MKEKKKKKEMVSFVYIFRWQVTFNMTG